MMKNKIRKGVCLLTVLLAVCLVLVPAISMAGNAQEVADDTLQEAQGTQAPQPQETQAAVQQDKQPEESTEPGLDAQPQASEPAASSEQAELSPAPAEQNSAMQLNEGMNNELTASAPQKISELFPDAKFANIIKVKLSKGSIDATVTQDELLGITELYLSSEVSNLTGIKNLANLELLQEYGNPDIEIPSEIGSLKKLEHLRLQNNALSSLPPEIGGLTALQELDLSGNHFGSIPDVVFSLPGLKRLVLSDNRLQELPVEIGNLTGLEFLALNNNQISSVSPGIGTLKNLQVLMLGNNQITSVPEEYGDLDSLTSINLENNRLTSVPDAITRLQKVTSISLNGNKLSALPAGIGNLQELSQLVVYDNNLTSLPEEICDCPQLEMINADKNNLTSLPAGLGKLTKLFSLNINDNKLTSLPDVIGSFDELRVLQADGNRLSALPASIGRLPQCYEVSARNNDLTVLPDEIADMQKLDKLYLSGNHLTDVSLVPDKVSDFDARNQSVTINLYRKTITLPATYTPPTGSIVLWDRGYARNEMVSNSFYKSGAFQLSANPQSGKLESKSGEFSINYVISLRDKLSVDIGTQEINLQEGEFYTVSPTSDVMDGYEVQYSFNITQGTNVARIVAPNKIVGMEAGRAYLKIKGEVKGTGVTGEITVPVTVGQAAPNMSGTQYPILDGNGQTAYKGTAFLEFRFDAPLDQFENVWLDNELLTRGIDYTVREGSTIIKLHKSLLDRLENGTHTLVAGFTDGYAKVDFDVNNDVSTKKSPKTGDETPIGLLVLGAMCSAAVLAAALVKKRKAGETK